MYLKNKHLLILPFIMIQSIHGQVAVSDAFQNTIKKISKDRIKSEIVEWIGKQDIVTGIIAKDLITQLIDNGKNEEAVLKSTANVTVTMLYLGGIKKIADECLKEHPELIDSSRIYGWTSNDLVAYTALYYYYSERIKYNLYVSSEILKMQNVKAKVENLRTKEGQKLPAVVARFISNIKRRKDGSNYYWLDVRVIEFIQLNFSKLMLEHAAYRASVDSTMISLRAVLKDSMLQDVSGIMFLKKTVSDMIRAYQLSYKSNNIFVLDKALLGGNDTVAARLAASSANDINNILAEPFNSLIQSSEYSFVDIEGAKKTIMSVVRQLLEQWINESKQSGWKFEYSFSLGGTYFSNYSQSIDFTVIDQLRYVEHWENSALYAFVGGFFDPLIKNTIYKDGVKVYLTGIGYQYSNMHIDMILGIPYTDLKGKYGAGVSVGYELPIFDVFQ
jgi:molybdopterin-binding protein